MKEFTYKRNVLNPDALIKRLVIDGGPNQVVVLVLVDQHVIGEKGSIQVSRIIVHAQYLVQRDQLLRCPFIYEVLCESVKSVKGMLKKFRKGKVRKVL